MADESTTLSPADLARLEASKECMADRQMWRYMLTSVATLSAAVTIVLLPRLFSAPFR